MPVCCCITHVHADIACLNACCVFQMGGLGSVGGLVAAAFVVVSGVGLQMGDLVDIVG